MDPGGEGPGYVQRGVALPDTLELVLAAIERHTALTPDRDALVFPESGTSMSWRELRLGTLEAAPDKIGWDIGSSPFAL